jgi:cytochrome c-type biogenesis protein CcmF
MIPELGHLALILTLTLALAQAVLPLLGAQRGIVGWMAVGRTAAYGQFTFLLVAFVCLAVSFVNNDFSVVYVANNSNTALPVPYRIAAVWGAHEGSLLLWSLVLSLWMVAVAYFSRSVPLTFIGRVLAVMGAINIGFLLFMLLTSNPFLRHFPAPEEGRDLNPLLQDPGLVVHPPMLYMGYVGFSVAFSFAIAALLGGRLNAAWARWSRPWTVIAWVFLTLGITLGSWWAYYELGWGGWWFWDPVENASFMPWLVGTALIHSLAITEKRDAFKRWTVLLAICAFSLSLLGTFLVRSGVLTSVHAFATDPARGIFILIFLGITVGGSLLLYALRAPHVRDTGSFDPISREGFLLGNNLILLTAAASVLLGTLYPLALDVLGLGKISVGPPYFNTLFAPLMVVLGLLLGLGTLSRWKQQPFWSLLRRLGLGFALCLAVAVTVPFLIDHGQLLIQVAAGLLSAFWVALTSLIGIRERLVHKRTLGGMVRVLPRAFVGMSLAHGGLAMAIIGVTLSSMYGTERDVKLTLGESAEVGGYRFVLDAVDDLEGPNYRAVEARVSVYRGEERITELRPQKRIYRVQTMPMTEAGIDAGLFRDLYVALGEPLGEKSWSMRLQFKPYVRWIWFGGLMMALGGVLAATDRRYRLAPRQSEVSAKTAALATTAT